MTMRNAAVFWSLGALLRSLFAGRLAGALAVGCIVVLVVPAAAFGQAGDPFAIDGEDDHEIEPADGLGELPELPANGGPNLGNPRVSGGRAPQGVAQPVPWDVRAVDGRAGQPVSTRRACELRGAGWEYTEERVRMQPPTVSGHDFSRELTVPCRDASLSASGGVTLPQHCDNGVNSVVEMLR
ncbi:MAG: hypothetical protein KC653_00300, partial [Candidatus Andersenbacteria bacterium]|nr:hypothetical protein [Candidatus Andersenbacteria bacterium]